GVDAHRVGVEQEADQQSGVKRRLTAGFDLVGGVEGVEVELGYRVEEEENEVVLGKAFRRGEGEVGVSRRVPGTIFLAPGRSHPSSNHEETRWRLVATEDAPSGVSWVQLTEYSITH